MKKQSKHLDFEVSKEILKEILSLNKGNKHSGGLIILFNYALVALCIYLTLGISYWFYPLSLIVIGSVHRTFANLLHEGSHNMLASNKIINKIYGAYLTGYPIFHMVIPYQRTHLQGHHRFLGDPEKDPDYHFHIQCGLYNPREKSWIFFTKNLFLAVIGYRSLSYIRYIFRDRIFFDTTGMSKARRKETMWERFYFLLTWVVIITAFAWTGYMVEFLLFWIVPMFTTGIAIGWIAELAEHYPLPESESIPLMLARNRHGWMIENFLFGRHGDRYHLIHHLSPGIPCYNLKTAHQILLKDENYRTWDSIWGGIFTKAQPNTESLLTYVRKYKHWQQQGGREGSESFAFFMLNQYHKLDQREAPPHTNKSKKPVEPQPEEAESQSLV